MFMIKMKRPVLETGISMDYLIFFLNFNTIIVESSLTFIKVNSKNCLLYWGWEGTGQEL